ncbi:hypothetical protein BJY04DRAFT_220823 [Aspergillus karnatakaensis]|uniref:uncharacterized protein n=1 Tax=Aspergillus karnatakaensis TaxID=1810916 RepID=UPI003CCDBB51
MEHYTYPDPPYIEEQIGAKLNLDIFPDPPDDYRPLGYKSLIGASSGRRPSREDILRWFDFYFWGFKVELRPRTNAMIGKARRKLMYYTAPHHRPQDLDRFYECKGDAGPRLLDYTKVPWDALPFNSRERLQVYAPVSRFYPNLLADGIRPGKAFVRPEDAPQCWRDTWVEQASLSSSRMHSADPAIASFLPHALKVANDSGLEQWQSSLLRESIQRATMNFAYWNLERHSSAASRLPPRHLHATSADEILIWNVLGRGPVYSGNSSAIDCVITAGMLLDAGSTNADRHDPDWCHEYNELQRASIELSDANWDLCTPETGAKLKEDFRVLMKKVKSDVEDSDPNAVSSLWDAVANRLNQFTVSYHEVTTTCECDSEDIKEEHIVAHCITPPVLDPERYADGVIMQELFQRAFAPQQPLDCANCEETNKIRVRRAFKELPPRLAVKPMPGTSLLDHTENIRFKYKKADGTRDFATYRWLGGIYRDQDSYRVFWSGANRGENNIQGVRMYDSTNHGLIVSEGVPTLDKVPSRWWENKQVPLLFYERVTNPSMGVLREALNTVC